MQTPRARARAGQHDADLSRGPRHQLRRAARRRGRRGGGFGRELASAAHARSRSAADERTGVADAVVEELRAARARAARRTARWPRASAPTGRGPRRPRRATWPTGRAEQGIVCCWTGTGASIAANKVPGVRAALCGDAATADGARRWNDANVLALSLRTTRRRCSRRSSTRGSPARRPRRRRPRERRAPRRDLGRAGRRGRARPHRAATRAWPRARRRSRGADQLDRARAARRAAARRSPSRRSGTSSANGVTDGGGVALEHRQPDPEAEAACSGSDHEEQRRQRRRGRCRPARRRPRPGPRRRARRASSGSGGRTRWPRRAARARRAAGRGG